jgi:hypothetical protein
MIKLKTLNVRKVDPTVNTKGKVEFSYRDCYIRENLIGGMIMFENDPGITDNWVIKEIKEHCIKHNLRLCTIYTINGMPHYDNIIIDETVLQLMNKIN